MIQLVFITRAASVCAFALLAFALLYPPTAAADPGTDLFRDVMANGRLCAFGKGPTDRQECYVRAAPSRCEKEARSGVMGNGLLLKQLRACVISCGNAGAWSSTIGDCSRDLIIEDAGLRLITMEYSGCFSDLFGDLRDDCMAAADGKSQIDTFLGPED